METSLVIILLTISCCLSAPLIMVLIVFERELKKSSVELKEPTEPKAKVSDPYIRSNDFVFAEWITKLHTRIDNVDKFQTQTSKQLCRDVESLRKELEKLKDSISK